MVDTASALSERGDRAAQPEGLGAAFRVIRRGMGATPELFEGLWATALLGLMTVVSKLTIPILIQQVIDRGGLLQGRVELRPIIVLSALAIGVILVAAMAAFWARRRMAQRAEAALRTLRVKTFDHIHHLSLARHNDASTGVLISRVTSDVDTVTQFVEWGMYVWLIEPVVLTGMFVTIAWYSWPLAILAFLLTFPALIAVRWSQRRMGPAFDRRRSAVGTMLGAFSEALSGAEVIRAYGTQDRFNANLDRAVQERYDAGIRANVFNASVYVIGDLAAAFMLSCILVVGVTQRDSLGLTAGELVGALLLTSMIQNPLASLTEVLDRSQQAISGWRKIIDVLDIAPAGLDPETGADLERGALRVTADSVGFDYGDGVPVLRNVSIDIQAGSTVAIVGETGSGKSTFARLLCRLADPTEGAIRLNDVDVTELSGPARHRGVRLVPQDGFLFDTTVAENISYGRAGTTAADIDRAVALLELDDWVAGLPQGLDTPVGHRGGALSVGERQLVSFIRAAVADPGLLILDEATSSVDPQTDVTLTRALRRLAQGRTVISIAHRLATAETADLILVFDQGELVQVGPHSELTRRPGIYAELHAAWELRG